jgi:hypothetical protein
VSIGRVRALTVNTVNSRLSKFLLLNGKPIEKSVVLLIYEDIFPLYTGSAVVVCILICIRMDDLSKPWINLVFFLFRVSYL